MSDRERPSAVVVGGSLSGLSAALSLAMSGWRVTVFERSSSVADGIGISIDTRLLEAVTGMSADGLPTMRVGWTSTGWGLLHRFLLDACAAQPLIALHRSTRVERVERVGNRVAVRVAGAPLEPVDLVVGADGVRSVVRRFVAPERPDAAFSGLLLWRGAVEEADSGGFSPADLRFQLHYVAPSMVGTYGIPAGGEHVDQRRAVFIAFDPDRVGLLRRLGAVADDRVVRTINGAELPPSVVQEMARDARGWPVRWSNQAAALIEDRAIIGTPLAEYRPERLRRDRVVLIGDAAHAVGPTTGAGFDSGMRDVLALAEELRGASSHDVVAALERYEEVRLRPAQDLVERSQAWSRSIARSARC